MLLYSENVADISAVFPKLAPYTKLRDEALTRCYAIDGYSDLCKTDPEKACRIYDKIKNEVKKEMNLL